MSTISVVLMESKSPSIESYLIGIYLLLTPMYGGQATLVVIPYLPILLCLVYLIAKRKFKIISIPIGLKFYLFFGVWALFSHLWIGPYQIKYGGIIFLVLTIMITILNSHLLKNKNDLINILTIYSLSIIPIFYLNISDIQKSLNLQASLGGGRFYGTFGNANTAGMYGVTICWAVLYIFFQSELPRLKKIILLALLPLAFELVLISGSRKAYAGIAIVALFIYVFLIKNYGKKRVILSVFSAVFFGLGLFYIYEVFSNSIFYFRFEKLISGDSDSVEDRSRLMSKAIDLWQDNPITGVGFDSFRYHNSDAMPSHSSITETLVSTGIIGFFLYFSSFIVILSLFYKSYKRSKVIGDRLFQNDIQFFLLFFIVFLFFNTSAILYNSRDMWPILSLIYIYVIKNMQSYRQNKLFNSV